MPLATYPKLASRSKRAQRSRRWDEVVAYLVEIWIADYFATASESDLVQTNLAGFSYLFDLKADRLLAAWGVSQGRNSADRDTARMAGHPKAGGSTYHRGHAIPHRMGGGTDINLVPQLGSVNVGRFRQLEREAQAAPGSLYFTYWVYEGALHANDAPSQVPTHVDQGLLIFGRPPQVRHHSN
jgi:hypothetical protein